MNERGRPIHERLIVIGDRVLIEPDQADDRSEVGLYLPRWVVEKDSVQAGRIVACGPGIPLPDPSSIEEEPWKSHDQGGRHVPMQAAVGDYAIFLRKASVEVKFEGKTYLIVPQSAILLLDRDSDLRRIRRPGEVLAEDDLPPNEGDDTDLPDDLGGEATG